MRMYELWRWTPHGENPARLEDEGMPVLFDDQATAEAYARIEIETMGARILAIPVPVGHA